MNYTVTVLTPTLVGDGKRLAPIDYMVWRDQVNVLDQDRIFALLSKGPRLEGYLSQLRRATKLDFASWGGFAQNYADRRIPFEDSSCASGWEKAPADACFIPTFTSSHRGPYLPGSAVKGALRNGFLFANLKSLKRDTDKPNRRPGEIAERQALGSGGSDRMRAITAGDSNAVARDHFRVFMLRISTLIPKEPGRFSLGWKQAGRGAAAGNRPADAVPSFAEMAVPGTRFEGIWRENDFLNRPEVRQVLRWSNPVTRESVLAAANLYAGKQLELHARYAEWTGISDLGSSVAQLQARLDQVRVAGGCLLNIGHGGGYLSKSSGIGVAEDELRGMLGSLPHYERAIRTGLPFPKTRKIVFLKDKPATLPGWVELAF